MRFEDWLRKQKLTALHSAFSPLSLKDTSMAVVIEMAKEGATVPFMARYRKEKTLNLDEVGIQFILDGHERWQETLKRQSFILAEIEKQGQLTEVMKVAIQSSFDLDTLEDIYAPFKQKRKTKATLAKDAGIEPLAKLLWSLSHGEPAEPNLKSVDELNEYAKTFVKSEPLVSVGNKPKFNDVASVLQGAYDIFTEKLADEVILRDLVRKTLHEESFLQSKKTEKSKPASKYENYFDYSELSKNLILAKNSHRYLAVRRGWIEEELSISFCGPKTQEDVLEQKLLMAFETASCPDKNFFLSEALIKCARMALKVYVLPAMEKELHKHLKEAADAAAIGVFAENVKNLLLASPFGSKTVLGIDPGIRTGSKLALVNSAGQFVASNVIRIQTESEKKEAAAMILACIQEAKVEAIGVGNGTAGRETESFIREVLKENNRTEIPVVLVNEAGASVYSASDVAREEFPNLDVTVRGAISIARRLQDPLAELVKIDPKSIGVGQYQHDINPIQLKKSLDLVVDSCVNKVGVNLNTASSHLLARVAGVGPGLAKSIVEFRVSHGVFRSRSQLLDVPRFSKKAFEQASGFLRIPDSINPLDNTGVHPERYDLLKTYAARVGKTLSQIIGSEGVKGLREDSEFRKELGDFTFEDIVNELEKPGRDPREMFVVFRFRDDIHELKDLKLGMQCPGIVTNVTNFGAFVDIGVHQDGLVHRSQIADRFVEDPSEIVKPGDRVNVRVLEINVDKKQISLSMRSEASVAPPAPETKNFAPRAQMKPRVTRQEPDVSRNNDRNSAPRNHQNPQKFNPGDRRPRSENTQNQSPQNRHQKPSHSNQGPRESSDRAGPRPERSGNAFKNNAFGQLANFRESFAAPDKAKKRH